MPRDNKKKQKGGRVLGRGGYGCAIAPAVACSAKNDPKKLKNQVTKLIDMSKMGKDEKDSLLEEFKISQKFKTVDPDNKYFLGGIEHCEITNKHKSLSKEDLKKCGITTTKKIPLMNIIMKKGKDMDKIVPRLSYKDLLKSVAHLLVGARKAVYELNLLLLDIKHLNILYVNSDTEKNKIHPVFIDFGPELIAQSKRQFKVLLRGFDSYYQVWPLEMLLTMYDNASKTPMMPIRNWKEYFNSKEEMMKILEKEKKNNLRKFRQNIKTYEGFDIQKHPDQMKDLIDQFKLDIDGNYKMIMDKIMVYEIANSFSHLEVNRPELLKVLRPMLNPDYESRLTISQSLRRIRRKIGSIQEKDLLIDYKELTTFQKFKRFMTKKRGAGVMNGGGTMKKKEQTWAQYWAGERYNESLRRCKAMKIKNKCKCKNKCGCKNKCKCKDKCGCKDKCRCKDKCKCKDKCGCKDKCRCKNKCRCKKKCKCQNGGSIFLPGSSYAKLKPKKKVVKKPKKKVVKKSKKKVVKKSKKKVIKKSKKKVVKKPKKKVVKK